MGKELTLQELASKEAGQLQNSTIRPSSDAIKSASEISVKDLAKNLPGKEKSEEGTKPPVIVENAINAMNERLAESKRFIHDEVMPVVKENIKEMKMDQELAGTTNNEAPTEDFLEQQKDNQKKRERVR